MTNVQYDNITAYRIVDIDKATSQHTIRINCKEEVGSILMCSVDSNVFGYECMAGQVNYSGKNNVKLVFVDTEGQIISSNSNADFADTIMSQYIMPSSKMSFDIVVVDTNSDISGNIVTVQLLLEVQCRAYSSESMPRLVEGEGLYTHHQHVEVVQDIDNMNIPADIRCQMSTNANITRVVMADSRVSCTDYTLLDGILTASGDVVVGLMYMSEEKLCYDQLVSPYRTELECPMKGGQLSVVPAVKNTRIKLDIVEEQLNNVFEVEVGVAMSVTTMTTVPVQLADDCYTKDSILQLERANLTTTLPCGSVSARVSIEQNLTGTDYDGIIALVNVGSAVTNCRYMDRQVSVEGIINGTLLYYQDDKVTSRLIELPFVENVAIDYITSGCNGNATATVLSSQCHYVAGTLTVKVELCIDILSHRNVTHAVITGIEETPLQGVAKSGIEVCMAKAGETLWELAKALHMDENEILSINPDITSPLTQDTKIVIYNKM